MFNPMRTVEIVLNDDLLNRLGTGSLVGFAMGKDYAAVGPGTHVRLVFPLHSLAWCAAHGGPDSVLLVEHAPMCLAEGVLDLVRLGATVEVVELRG